MIPDMVPCPQCGVLPGSPHGCLPEPLRKPLSADRRRELATEILTRFQPPRPPEPTPPASVAYSAPESVTSGFPKTTMGLEAAASHGFVMTIDTEGSGGTDSLARKLEEDAEQRVLDALVRVAVRKLLRRLPPEQRGLAVAARAEKLFRASLLPLLDLHVQETKIALVTETPKEPS